MDKQKIMIDNVDVSECEFFEECEIKIDNSECLAHSRHFYEGAFYDCCDEHPDCYYKQLQREKQDSQEARDTAIKEFNRAEKLSQTLTDIRKIAEKEVKHAPDGETFARPEIKQILQKISEVNNDR